MEKDDEILSPASGGSQSPAWQRQNDQIGLTPTQNKTLTLDLPRKDCWSEWATLVLIEAWGER
ncbi:hypothetical protein D8674_008098 [Pyrus ussuriensis x Pyrus communis]|uniref:Uncharacterized protein n=1 Tax=Pyrus ussuriensis x Pyrus communis TaxID=2448454 RepID=A0A5N5HS38_9ROSA|nr:hypothetical protein D8674_008098 [Pyrus ussuriensis x Pyrus communis]